MRLESFPWGGCSIIEALVSGKLHVQPAQKIAKTGKPFVFEKVRVHVSDADVFVIVIAFSQAACEALLALGDGDAVALAGSLTPKASTDREGIARPALDLVASQVLTCLPCDAQAQGPRAQATQSDRTPAGKPPR